jgi:hypothetical protein
MAVPELALRRAGYCIVAGGVVAPALEHNACHWPPTGAAHQFDRSSMALAHAFEATTDVLLAMVLIVAGVFWRKQV